MIQRALSFGPQAYGYTVDECRTVCEDFEYFAIQATSWCSCTNDLSAAQQYGVSNGCSADNTGGGLANSLYRNINVVIDYNHIGCYRDTGVRALSSGPHDFGYTVASCRVVCEDFEYFAIQAGSWCSCTNDLSAAQQYGVSTGCSSDNTGGGLANSLYENTNIVIDYNYIGCYRDTGVRALSAGPQNYGYTVASCRATCDNYQYFAVQAGSWCCCTNDLSEAQQYGASTGCSSDGTGGGLANSLYENTNIVRPYQYIGCFADTGNRYFFLLHKLYK